jgi:hypothetical protein
LRRTPQYASFLRIRAPCLQPFYEAAPNGITRIDPVVKASAKLLPIDAVAVVGKAVPEKFPVMFREEMLPGKISAGVNRFPF